MPPIWRWWVQSVLGGSRKRSHAHSKSETKSWWIPEQLSKCSSGEGSLQPWLRCMSLRWRGQGEMQQYKSPFHFTIFPRGEKFNWNGNTVCVKSSSLVWLFRTKDYWSPPHLSYQLKSCLMLLDYWIQYCYDPWLSGLLAVRACV